MFAAFYHMRVLESYRIWMSYMRKTISGLFWGSVIRILYALVAFTEAISFPAFRYNHVIKGKKMTGRFTIFPYLCSCGKTDYWKISGNKIRCPHCDSSFPISSSGVISFFQEKSEQNEYFDNLYRTGYAHVMDKFKKDKEGVYQRSTERAEEHLKLCGFDMTEPLDNLSILDVACGVGWISAGLMQNKKLTNCKNHAYDISPDGLVRLSKFTKKLKSTNRLELSLQMPKIWNFGMQPLMWSSAAQCFITLIIMKEFWRIVAGLWNLAV